MQISEKTSPEDTDRNVFLLRSARCYHWLSVNIWQCEASTNHCKEGEYFSQRPLNRPTTNQGVRTCFKHLCRIIQTRIWRTVRILAATLTEKSICSTEKRPDLRDSSFNFVDYSVRRRTTPSLFVVVFPLMTDDIRNTCDPPSSGAVLMLCLKGKKQQQKKQNNVWREKKSNVAMGNYLSWKWALNDLRSKKNYD